jgi:hypothetical protein
MKVDIPTKECKSSNNSSSYCTTVGKFLIVVLSVISAVILIGGPVLILLTPTLADNTDNMLLHPAFAQTNNTTNTTNSTGQKPVDGYDAPERHESSILHNYERPELRVHHYCKPAEGVVLVCQLYDSESPNAKLIGIEYFISASDYSSLPNREKANWHVHNMTSFALDKPIFHELSPEQGQAQLQKLVGTFGKIIITWNPDDKVPAYTPQIVIPDSPFMLNNTK